MNPEQDHWKRLAEKAGAAWPQGPSEAPPGFAARVVRAAFARPAEPSWIPTFAWRAVAVAAAVTALTIGMNVKPIQGWVEDEAAALSNVWIELELQDLS